MNRAEFMKELEYLLQDIPQEDKEEALAYYRDYLEDAGDEQEAQVIKEFGSPERVAAIIRSDLSGHLEEGGAFTESGYQDERFRDPNYQVVERKELPEQREPAEKTEKPGAGPRHRQEDSLVKRLFKVGALLLLLVIAGPILLGLGGGAVSLVVGILACLLVAVILIGVLTVTACIGAVVLVILGIGAMVTQPWSGVLILGFGIFVLGLALIGIALSILIYGRFIPFCIRSVVDTISGLIHRRGRKTA